MLRRWLVAAAVLTASFGTPANAGEWTTVYSKDEFDGKDRYFAMTSLKEPNFMFICDAETARMRILYKTGEKMPRSVRKQLPMSASLAVIVDDQPVRSYPGQIAEIEKKLVFESRGDGLRDFGNIIGAAHRRLLVAVDQYDGKYFRQEFDVKRSGPSIAKIFTICDGLKKKRG